MPVQSRAALLPRILRPGQTPSHPAEGDECWLWPHGECLTRVELPWITDHLGKSLHMNKKELGEGLYRKKNVNILSEIQKSISVLEKRTGYHKNDKTDSEQIEKILMFISVRALTCMQGRRAEDPRWAPR